MKIVFFSKAISREGVQSDSKKLYVPLQLQKYVNHCGSWHHQNVNGSRTTHIKTYMTEPKNIIKRIATSRFYNEKQLLYVDTDVSGVKECGS